MKKQITFWMTLLLMVVHIQTQAQLFRRLKERIQQKIEDKINNKAEREIDKQIDGVFDKKSKTKREKTKNTQKRYQTQQTGERNKDYGNSTIQHQGDLGKVNIKHLGQTVIRREGDEFRISGSWITQTADVFDGYVLVVKNGKSFENINNKKTFTIPQEATLKLSYDPKLYAFHQPENDGFSRNFSKKAQDFSIKKGDVTININKKDFVKITFNGSANLSHSFDSETTYNEQISGTISTTEPEYFATKVASKETPTHNQPTASSTYAEKQKHTGKYVFDKSIEITLTEGTQRYPLEFFLGIDKTISAMYIDPLEYMEKDSDMPNMQRAKIYTVITPTGVESFMNVMGMKMKNSSTASKAVEKQDISDKLPYKEDLEKTGKTKVILGYLCNEYIFKQRNDVANIWVTKELPFEGYYIPTMGMSSNDIYDGFVMELLMNSQGKKLHAKVTKINLNKSLVIDPSEYRSGLGL